MNGQPTQPNHYIMTLVIYFGLLPLVYFIPPVRNIGIAFLLNKHIKCLTGEISNLEEKLKGQPVNC